MAVDKNIPIGEPGVASFASETWGQAEPRFGEGVPTTTTMTVTASGADIDLPLYSVLGSDGLLHDEAVGEPVGILAEPIFIADGDTMTFPIYREGHWNMDALNWHASYSTDALKKAAFEGSTSPNIFISKATHNSDAIY